MTEAGRALVAHHSALIFDVVGANYIRTDMPTLEEVSKHDHESVVELHRICIEMTTKNIQESILDAFKLRDDAMSLFNLGYMNLRQRGMMEKLFWAFCTKSLQIAAQMPRPPEECEELRKLLVDSYYCNFSVFQSAPDIWAVDQMFPIMPIHRLNEFPNRQGQLLDLSCDSDGKIDKFIDIKDVKDYLPLHTIKDGQRYYIGMFLVGAYQEILGDFHNLFGDTDAVHVSLTSSGYVIDHVVEGDTVQEVLGYVQYDRPSLIRNVRNAVESSLLKKTITLEESRLLLRYYEEGLNGYTYLDHPSEDDAITPVDALRRLGQKQVDAGTPIPASNGSATNGNTSTVSGSGTA